MASGVWVAVWFCIDFCIVFLAWNNFTWHWGFYVCDCVSAYGPLFFSSCTYYTSIFTFWWLPEPGLCVWERACGGKSWCRNRGNTDGLWWIALLGGWLYRMHFGYCLEQICGRSHIAHSQITMKTAYAHQSRLLESLLTSSTIYHIQFAMHARTAQLCPSSFITKCTSLSFSSKHFGFIVHRFPWLSTERMFQMFEISHRAKKCYASFTPERADRLLSKRSSSNILVFEHPKLPRAQHYWHICHETKLHLITQWSEFLPGLAHSQRHVKKPYIPFLVMY